MFHPAADSFLWTKQRFSPAFMTMRCGIEHGSEVMCVGSGQLAMCFKHKHDCVNERLNVRLISVAGDCSEESQRSYSWSERRSALTHSCLFIKVICDPVCPKTEKISRVCVCVFVVVRANTVHIGPLLCYKGTCCQLRDHLLLLHSSQCAQIKANQTFCFLKPPPPERMEWNVLFCCWYAESGPDAQRRRKITVNLLKGSMAANYPTTQPIQSWPNNGKETSNS